MDVVELEGIALIVAALDILAWCLHITLDPYPKKEEPPRSTTLSESSLDATKGQILPPLTQETRHVLGRRKLLRQLPRSGQL